MLTDPFGIGCPGVIYAGTDYDESPEYSVFYIPEYRVLPIECSAVKSNSSEHFGVYVERRVAGFRTPQVLHPTVDHKISQGAMTLVSEKNKTHRAAMP